MRAATVPAVALLRLAGASTASERPIVVAVDSGVDPSVPGLVTVHKAVDGSSDTLDESGQRERP